MKIENILYPIEWDKKIIDILYNEIFINKSYSKFFDFNKNDTILDLGANIGMYSLYATEKMPSIKKIYMVEPLLQNFDYMIRNIMYNRKEDIHKFIFIKAAISKNGTSKIGGDISSPFLSDNGELTKTFSFIDFIKFYNIDKIDIMKVDIEGSELDMFNHETFDYIKNNNINRVCGELHPMKKHGEEMVLILKKFIDIGYDILITSVDGHDITNKMINNLVVNNDKNAWDYYNQVLFYCKKN